MVKCKRCGATNVHWRQSPNTRTGVQLHNKDGTAHICNYVYNDYAEQLSYFLNKVVIKESDSIDVLQQKRRLQEKMRWQPTAEERKTMATNVEKYKWWYK